MPAWSGEGPLLGHGQHFLPASSHGVRGEGALWGPFYKGTNPIHAGSTLMASSPQRPHFLIPSAWGLGFQHADLGGTHSDYSSLGALGGCGRFLSREVTKSDL